MAGRPKEFDETEVLEKAMELFWKQGYAATSTADLVRVLGMNKGSLYNTFVSKKHLFIRAMDTVEGQFMRAFEARLNAAKNPVVLIAEFFTSIPDEPKHIQMNGCFMGNTIAESSNVDPELEECARRHLAEFKRIFEAQIKRAQKDGHIKNQTPAEMLALHLINLWNGVNLTRRLKSDTKELKTLIEMNLAVLN